MRFLGEVRDEHQRYLDGDRWFQARDGLAAAVGRLLLARVRHRRGAPAVLGRPRRAGRRPPQGVPATSACRSWASASSTATATSASRCPPTAGSRSATPTSIPHAMALTPCDGDHASRSTWPARRSWPGCGRPRSAGCRCTCSTPTSRRTPPDLRAITDRLYGGETEHRLRQEILLGIGGVRALDALGIDAQVFHTNEGHAGFLGLERIRQLVKDPGLSYREAIEAVRAGVHLHHPHAGAGRHRPLPPRADRALLRRRGPARWGSASTSSWQLGHRPGDEPDERFNMAVMGLRLAGRSNAVAKLHGEVSREMFSDLWPDVPTEEVPITSVTNGVHAGTWVAPDMADLLTQHVLPGVARGRRRALGAPRRRPRRRAVARPRAGPRGAGGVRAPAAPRPADGARAQLERRRVDRLGARPTCPHHRLRPSLRHLQARHAAAVAARPAQARCCCRATGRCSSCSPASRIPADDTGKELIRQVSAFAADPEVRHRFVFVDDYDIAVARALLQGADVWLNNPRRPQEACGTSGMKSALNGGLNLSILDGWWDECFDGENGWAISSAEHLDDLERRDEVEAGSLFELLERQVVPLFYERWQGPVPRRWVQRVKHSLVTLGPVRHRRPHGARLHRAALRAHRRAGRRARRRRLRRRPRPGRRGRPTVDAAWPGVHVDHVELDDARRRPRHRARRGGDRRARRPRPRRRRRCSSSTAPPGRARSSPHPEVVVLEAAGAADDGHLRYRGRSPASRPVATASRCGSCPPTPRS